jgi:hypothetical protein
MFDDDQKKAVDEAKAKATAAAAAAPAVPVAPATASPPPQTAAVAPPAPAGPNPFDGRWSGMATFGGGGSQPLSATLRNGTGKGSWRNNRCGGDVTYTITIQPDGKFLVAMDGYDGGCQRSSGSFTGAVQNNTLRFTFGRGLGTFTMSK